jgi:predicted DsbA family dithiol-disulfide isomerase
MLHDLFGERAAIVIQDAWLTAAQRIHDPARADLLLRCLRRRAFSDGQPLDELDTLNAAGVDAGIASDTLEAWLADEGVETALREDMAATRSPLPEALALAHELSRNGSGT